jgi:hypothetical protein
MKLATQVILNNKYLLEGASIPKDILKSDIIMDFVIKEIDAMKWEIDQSEAGKRGAATITNKEDNVGVFRSVNIANKSTFPKYFKDIMKDNGTKKKFFAAVKRGKGPIWTRIALEAIERLKHGYKNTHGHDEPNKDFLAELDSPTPF